MENLNPTLNLDVSQLSAPEIQRLGVTVAQVRAVYTGPVAVIGPRPDSAFPGVWQLLDFTNKGQSISVALRYDDFTRKLAALGVKLPATLENSATSSAFPSFRNPFQGPGAEDAWRRLRAERGPIVTREEMIRRVQEQAAQKKQATPGV